MPDTIEIFSSLEAAAPTWLEFQEHGDLYIFQTYPWIENWYTHIGRRRGVEPCLVSVRAPSGAPRYFFPFGIERNSVGLRVLVWLGDVLADYGAPIVNAAAVHEAGDFRATWQHVLGQLPPVDAIWLKRMPQHIHSCPNPMLALPCDPYHSAAHSVSLEGDWDHFYEAHAGPKTRGTDRRKRRRLCELGPVGYTATDGSDAATFDRITAAMLEQKQIQYREIRAPDLLQAPGYREFFAQPVAGLRESGWLHLSALTVGERMVTTHWGMLHRGRFYYFMPGFERGPWTAFSPGRLLLIELLRECCEHGVRVFDFTVGDESYKRDWRDNELGLSQYFRACSRKGTVLGAYYRLFVRLAGNETTRALARRIRRRFH